MMRGSSREPVTLYVSCVNLLVPHCHPGNIFDKNYRAMGSGIDAFRINAMARFSRRFQLAA